MISDRMTTPVLPTPALQCTSRGGLGIAGSAVLLVWRRTDCISSKYAIGSRGKEERGKYLNEISLVYFLDFAVREMYI